MTDTRYFVISTQDRIEAGSDVVAITTSQVVASMATQAGWVVQTNLPLLTSTQEFIEWSAGRSAEP